MAAKFDLRRDLFLFVRTFTSKAESVRSSTGVFSGMRRIAVIAAYISAALFVWVPAS